jgi:hypothetical protein
MEISIPRRPGTQNASLGAGSDWMMNTVKSSLSLLVAREVY